MTRAASPKLVAYATLGGLGLLAALVTGRPELAAIALPFLAVLGAALVLAADPQVEVESMLERDRLLEGDEIGVELRLSAKHAVQRAEVLLVVPPALALVDGRNPTATHVSARKPATLDLRLRPERWGVFDLRDVHVRARDFFGMFVWTSQVQGSPRTCPFGSIRGRRRSLTCSARRRPSSSAGTSSPAARGRESSSPT